MIAELQRTLRRLLHHPDRGRLRRRHGDPGPLAATARPERHRARRPGRGLRDHRAHRRPGRGPHRPGRGPRRPGRRRLGGRRLGRQGAGPGLRRAARWSARRLATAGGAGDRERAAVNDAARRGRRPRLRRRRQGHGRGRALRRRRRCARSCASTGERRPRTTSSRRTAGTTRSPSSGRAPSPGVPTHLTRFVVVDPLALAAEAAALGNPFHLLTVDGDALLATPWHRAANRAAGAAARRGPARFVRHGHRADHGVRPGAPRRAPGRRRPLAARAAATPGRGPRPPDRRSTARSTRRRSTTSWTPSVAFGAAVSDRGPRVHRAAAARGAAASSRARRACCWTSGGAGTRTPPGRPRRSPTWLALCRRRWSSGSGWCGPTRPGTAPGPFVTEAPLRPAGGAQRRRRVAGRVPGRALRRGRPPVRRRGGRRRRRAGRHPPGRGRCRTCASARRTRWTGPAGTGSRPARSGIWATRPALTALLGGPGPASMHRPDDWAAEIGDLLGAPVALISCGPTAADKRISALSGV